MWSLWGSLLYVSGLRQSNILYRLLGLLMIIAPFFLEIHSSGVPTDAVLVLLGMICGICLWLVGIMTKQHAKHVAVLNDCS